MSGLAGVLLRPISMHPECHLYFVENKQLVCDGGLRSLVNLRVSARLGLIRQPCSATCFEIAKRTETQASVHSLRFKPSAPSERLSLWRFEQIVRRSVFSVKQAPCQGRSKTRPLGRSKSRPVNRCEVVEY